MSGAPRFRIVQGRGIGERNAQQSAQAAPSPQPPLPQEIKYDADRVKYENAVCYADNKYKHAYQPSPVNNQPLQHPSHRTYIQQPMVNPASPAIADPGGSETLEKKPALTDQADLEVVGKCVRFFRTLISLSKGSNEQGGNSNQANREVTIQRVRDLVSNVIFGNLPVEEFTRGLQECLNSQAQPHLLPFLRRTIPQLRDALKKGIVQLEGIEVPPEFADVHELVEQKVILPDGSAAQQIGSGHINMIPVSMAIPVASVQPIVQHALPAADVEMEDNPRPEEDTAIHVRALQENALKSALIRPEDIMRRITERMKEACFIEEEVLTAISDAAEYRLREILGELAVLAEHRMDNLRMSQTYVPIDDIKSQIRFLENLDRQQFEQNENREKEALIRMSKGKGMAKETIEKAKEMQRADAEAKRNRDANAAAIAALSSKSAKPRWDNAPGTATGGGVLMRPKTIRINIRDFQALASTDLLCARTNIVHKLAMGGGGQTEML